MLVNCPCFIIKNLLIFLQMSVWMIVTAAIKAPALTSRLPHSHAGGASAIQAGLVKAVVKVG